MRAARVTVAVLAASLLLGVPAASAAPRVSIHVKRVITFGQSAKLTGRLAGVKKHAGVRVALEIKLFPYKQVFKRLATRKTDSAGRFTFRAKPDRNARYRVRVATGSPTSRQVPLFVNGIPRTFVHVRGARAHLRMTFSFSPLLSTAPFSGRALHWYFRLNSKKRFHRIATNRTHRARAGRIGGSLNYKLPKSVGHKKFSIAWCFRPHRHGDVGIGDPRTSFKACP